MRSILASTFAALLTVSVALPAMAQSGATAAAPTSPVAASPVAAPIASPTVAKPASADATKMVKPATTPSTGAAAMHKRPTGTPAASAAPATPAAPVVKSN